MVYRPAARLPVLGNALVEWARVVYSEFTPEIFIPSATHAENGPSLRVQLRGCQKLFRDRFAILGGASVIRVTSEDLEPRHCAPLTLALSGPLFQRLAFLIRERNFGAGMEHARTGQ